MQGLHDEAHAQPHHERVDDVGKSGTNARHKAIPPAFVQGALHAEYAHGPHGGRGHKTDDDSLEDEIEYV